MEISATPIQIRSNCISAYPMMLETSECARSLDWSRRRLMPVMCTVTPPYAALSCHAGGRHQGVKVKAPGEMSRQVGSDLILPLLPWRIRPAPTNRTFCPWKLFQQAGIAHSAHMSKPWKTIPLNSLPNSELFHATVAYCIGYPGIRQRAHKANL